MGELQSEVFKDKISLAFQTESTPDLSYQSDHLTNNDLAGLGCRPVADLPIKIAESLFGTYPLQKGNIDIRFGGTEYWGTRCLEINTGVAVCG